MLLCLRGKGTLGIPGLMRDEERDGGLGEGRSDGVAAVYALWDVLVHSVCVCMGMRGDAVCWMGA